MTQDAAGRVRPPVDDYPRWIVLVRWALLAVEAAIGFYFVLGVRLDLAVIYLAYGVVCLFFLLPLIRCVRCDYYGHRCNFGWGRWVAKAFPRDKVHTQSAYYGYSVLFWPLRIFPLFFGFMKFLNGLISVLAGQYGDFEFMPHGLYLVYIATLIVHRRFYRAASCTRCGERLRCPVYHSRALLPGPAGPDAAAGHPASTP